MTERDMQQGDGEIGTCHVCDQTFPTQEALLAHLRDEHPDDLLDREATA
jgi:hypothetical protein